MNKPTTPEEWCKGDAFNIIFHILDERPRIDTVEAIIRRWHGPDDPDIENIIDFVCHVGCLTRNRRLKKSDKQPICRLVWALASWECKTVVHFGQLENLYSWSYWLK